MLPTLEADYRGGVAKGSALRASFGCANVQAGRRQDAEEIASQSPFNPFNQANIACLGDKVRTFAALDRATIAGPSRIGRALHSSQSRHLSCSLIAVYDGEGEPSPIIPNGHTYGSSIVL